MTDPDVTTTQPTSGSNPVWMWLAGAFLALVLVAGGVALYASRGGDDPTAAPTPAPPSPASIKDQGDGFGTPITDRWGDRIEVPVNQFGQVLTQDSSQQLKPDEPGWMTDPARDVMWQLVYNIPVPFSTSDGPTRVADKVASGYAQTPQGMVLAAMDTMSRCSVPGDALAVACYEHRVTDGPVYEEMGTRVAKIGALPRQLTPGASLPPLSWAKVVNYADDYAAVELAQRDPRSADTYIVYLVEMVWVDGDWKMKATDTSHQGRVGVTNLEGFTKW
ncbi:MAG TPA: hypothetical protein PKA99_10410 [Dermatophilaceae bacterium]|jgi:hypothetical protein|nr:hypothetical protein [Dermatophilaceae bacterium]